MLITEFSNSYKVKHEQYGGIVYQSSKVLLLPCRGSLNGEVTKLYKRKLALISTFLAFHRISLAIS